MLFVSSCSAFREMERRQGARSGLERAELYAAAGLFDRAHDENETVLSLSGNGEPGDEALYNIALLYAAPDNDGRDYDRARESLDELAVRFPDSPLQQDAKIVKSLLDRLSAAGKYINEKDEEVAALAEKNKALNHLLAGQKLLAGGDFKKAQEENKRMLAGEGKGTLGDEALFNLGLIAAHSENPEKDFNASAGYFRRLMKEYPQSPLAEQAKVWLGVLTVIEKSEQVDIEIEEKKKELAK